MQPLQLGLTMRALIQMLARRGVARLTPGSRRLTSVSIER